MIVKSRTPARISLAGGGTDLPAYFKKHGGLCVSMAINIYQEIELRTGDDLFEGYTVMPGGIATELAYDILTHYGMGSMHHSVIKTSFDGVIGAGLGSSGAFAVGLIAAINKSQGKEIDRSLLSYDAWYEENKLWTTGAQDQLAATYGGFNFIKLDEKITIDKINKEGAEEIAKYLHLFYTGGTRKSSKMQKKLNEMTPEKVKHLNEIKEIAFFMSDAIIKGDMELVGKLMHSSWEVKKKLGVSSQKIDDIYQYARDNGALGGKLMGAGEVGYCVFFVDPKKKEDFLNAMKKKGLEATDFSIDWNGVQTRII